MIEATGIYKSFDDHQVIRGIDLVFESGQTNLIIGKSGSGKTVFLKILVGLLQPDSGSIRFAGNDVTILNPRARKQIQRKTGMLFQNGALFDSMSVIQNVMFPLRLYMRMSDKVARSRAQECLERVNLPDVGELAPSDISGGMRKRVAIARAIAPNPEYLFCDEPNSGLDPQTSILIDDLIRDITHEFNITTVVNTHDMNSVLAIGDRVNFLYDGRVEWAGTNHDVLISHNKRLNDFVFATPMARMLKDHPQEAEEELSEE